MEEKKELPLEQVALKSSYRRRSVECITVALSSKRVGEERNTFGESCLSFEDTLTLTQGVGEERLPFGELSANLAQGEVGGDRAENQVRQALLAQGRVGGDRAGKVC
jgi:hypothetical protein